MQLEISLIVFCLVKSYLEISAIHLPVYFFKRMRSCRNPEKLDSRTGAIFTVHDAKSRHFVLKRNSLVNTQFNGMELTFWPRHAHCELRIFLWRIPWRGLLVSRMRWNTWRPDGTTGGIFFCRLHCVFHLTVHVGSILIFLNVAYAMHYDVFTWMPIQNNKGAFTWRFWLHVE